jgi:dihydrofolate reductase
MKDVFEKNSVLFLNIPEKDILKDELREELSKNIASSDILIIGSSDLLATFTEIAKIQK